MCETAWHRLRPDVLQVCRNPGFGRWTFRIPEKFGSRLDLACWRAVLLEAKMCARLSVLVSFAYVSSEAR